MQTGTNPPTMREARTLLLGKAKVAITQDAGTISKIKIYAK
jgi:hypothetical protein